MDREQRLPPLGYHREVYLDYLPDNPANGVTELQVEVTPA